jgi:hypothetical protein
MDKGGKLVLVLWGIMPSWKIHGSWELERTPLSCLHPNLTDPKASMFHGLAATAAEKTKSKFENTEVNWKKRGMHYPPLAVEMNGALGPTVQRFIKKIALVAKEVRGHNVSFFRHWWSMVLANAVHQSVAESFFMKRKAIFNEQPQIGLFTFSHWSGATRLSSV